MRTVADRVLAPSGKFVWNRVHSVRTIAKARQLWDEGLKTEEIGRKLRLSRNAVIGISYRNNFPQRAYPGRRVQTPLGVWCSIRAASRAHGLSPATGQYRVTRGLYGWSFIDER